MTFQEKYAKKYEEAYKVLQETEKHFDCANIIFEAICEEFDKQINKEYDGARIKRFKRSYLNDKFVVFVKFCRTYVVVSEERLCHLVSFRELELIDALTEKLREVGISFKRDDRFPDKFVFIAELVFDSNNNNSDSWDVKKAGYLFLGSP